MEVEKQVSLTRRDWLRAGAGALAAGAAPAAAPKKNVLFIAADDLRPETGCYGNPYIRTPHIDRLAAGGMVFESAYCQQAVCAPSRTSLLTGLRPDSTRVYDLNTHFRKNIPDAITLPELFKRNGYHTQSFGKVFHNGLDDERSWSAPSWPPGRQRGMEYIDLEALGRMRRAEPSRALKGEEYPALSWKKLHSWQAPDVPDDALQDGQVAARAVQALRDVKDKPFFLAVGFLRPHLPFTAPKRYFDMYSPKDLPVPRHRAPVKGLPPMAPHGWEELRGYTDIPKQGPLPPGKTEELIHGYYASTTFMDAQVGKLLDELKRLGLEENTIVVLWGDHGYHLGELDLWCKATNLELDTRSPLILRAPGQKNRGARTKRLVEFVDIYPALAGLCGLPAPTNLEGLSAAPLLDNPLLPWKKAAFSQFPRPWPWKGDWTTMGYTMRTERYRYTAWFDKDRTRVAEELYDYVADPAQTANLVDDPKYKGALRELRDLYAQGWRKAVPGV